MQLEAITRKTSDIVVAFGDEQLNITYYPNELRLEDVLNSDASSDRAVGELSRLLKDWDLTEDGQPVPIEPARLRRLPITVLTAVQKAISEDMNPGEASASS